MTLKKKIDLSESEGCWGRSMGGHTDVPRVSSLRCLPGSARARLQKTEYLELFLKKVSGFFQIWPGLGKQLEQKEEVC